MFKFGVQQLHLIIVQYRLCPAFQKNLEGYRELNTLA